MRPKIFHESPAGSERYPKEWHVSDTPAVIVAGQPHEYRRRELIEPDWTRLPGWRDVTREQWESAQWQRVNCVKNAKQLRTLMGDLIDERFYADLETDQTRFATMSMLIPPHMMNTMVPDRVPDTESFYADPIRNYMIPV